MCSYDHGAGQLQDQAHRQATRAAQAITEPKTQAKIPALLWFMPLVMSFMVPLRFVCVGANVDNYRIEGKHYRSNPTNGSIDLTNAIVMNTNCGKVWALVMKSTSTNKEASNVNIEKAHVIEGLARAACHIHGTDASKKLQKRIVDILDQADDSEEIHALEASNRIKQANINLLAGVALRLTAILGEISLPCQSLVGELEDLANSLIQEEPEAPAAVVN